MIILLSPAKSLDLDSSVPRAATSQPRLLAEALPIVELMRQRSVADIASLQGISEELATLNAARWAEFETPFDTHNARPAIRTFAGDVYQGFDAATLSTRDLTEAGKTVRILSGLYGVLRPGDLMQPYRLEMGTKLANPRGKDLYAWWGERVTALLAQDLDASPGARLVVNLASEEYANVVDFDALDAAVVSPRFEDEDAQGSYKIVSFLAKRARGAMARQLVRSRARTVRSIRSFDADGYRYVDAASTAEVPVFRRARSTGGGGTAGRRHAGVPGDGRHHGGRQRVGFFDAIFGRVSLS